MKEKRVAVTLRLPVFLQQRLREIAEKEGMSLNAWMLAKLEEKDAAKRSLEGGL